MTSRSSYIRMLARWQERKDYLSKLTRLAEANIKRARTDKALADLEREITRLEIAIRECAERITHYKARIASLPTPSTTRPRKLGRSQRGASEGHAFRVLQPAERGVK